jgi:hypothetical protein
LPWFFFFASVFVIKGNVCWAVCQAHQARASPGFCSIKWLAALLPLDGMLMLVHPGLREASMVKCLAQGHRETKCDPAEIRTWNFPLRCQQSATTLSCTWCRPTLWMAPKQWMLGEIITGAISHGVLRGSYLKITPVGTNRMAKWGISLSEHREWFSQGYLLLLRWNLKVCGALFCKIGMNNMEANCFFYSGASDHAPAGVCGCWCDRASTATDRTSITRTDRLSWRIYFQGL